MVAKLSRRKNVVKLSHLKETEIEMTLRQKEGGHETAIKSDLKGRKDSPVRKAVKMVS